MNHPASAPLDVVWNRTDADWASAVGRFMLNIGTINPSVRAQLSTDELTLLFHDCLSSLGEESFKPLLEKYGLLRHLPRLSFAPKLLFFAPGAYLPAKPSQNDFDGIGAMDAFTYPGDAPM